MTLWQNKGSDSGQVLILDILSRLTHHTARSLAGGLLKRTGEPGFAFVTQLPGNLGDSLVGIAQPVAGDFEPPLTQIAHRGLAYKIGKTCREAGTGDSHRPGVSASHRPSSRQRRYEFAELITDALEGYQLRSEALRVLHGYQPGTGIGEHRVVAIP